MENRNAFLLLRQGQQVDRALAGYMDWLDTAEQAIIEEEDQDQETDYGKNTFCLNQYYYQFEHMQHQPSM